MATGNNSPNEFSTEPMTSRDFLIEKPWVIWVLLFFFWTFIVTIYPLTDYTMSLEFPEKYISFDWAESITSSLLTFYSWFAFTPLIFWFGKKFSFGKNKNLALSLSGHIFLSVITIILYLFLTSGLLCVFINGKCSLPELISSVNQRLYQTGHFQVIVYWAILGVYIALNYYKKFRERELEASRLLLRSSKLESQLVKAQLDSLKMQLHPHFLFNTLHAISALIEDNPKRARRMIARLGELLRSTLDIAEQQTITLEKEIALTKLYLEIEQERFGEILQVKIDVSPGELDCLVPSLILQPLIENAIKHGITDTEKPAVIKIKVSRRNKQIDIFVEDNGPGFPKNKDFELENGIGLSNTKARLEQLYGENHNFNASNSEKGGAKISISIPCNRSNKENESR